MDLYFVVAELELSMDQVAAWRATLLPSKQTIDAVLETAEGPVRLDVHGETISLRAFLVDSAYFLVRKDLEAALGAAAVLGARGEWYSGSHEAGRAATLPAMPREVRLGELGAHVRRWTDEALALDTPPPAPGRLAMDPSTGRRIALGASAKPKAAKKPAAKPKVAKTIAAKRPTKKPSAKKRPARR